MGFWDAVSGRQREKRPNLDHLFALPGAAVTLESALELRPTGVGSVCFRAAEGLASGDAERTASTLVEEDGPVVERSVDSFGFTWLVVRGDPADVSGLVTDLHAVNTELELQGFASGLLCAVADPSPAAPVPRPAAALGETGRGLHIVGALSDGWGYTASGTGKVVWAMFAVPAADLPLAPGA